MSTPDLSGLGSADNLGVGTGDLSGLGPVRPIGGGGLGSRFPNSPQLPDFSGLNTRGPSRISSSTVSRIQTIEAGREILDRVRNRELTWQEAHSAISGMPDNLRNELLRQLQIQPHTTPDEFRAVAGGGGHTTITGALGSILKGGGHSGIVGNFITEAGAAVRGAPAGGYAMAKAFGHDEWNALIHHPDNLPGLLTAPFTGEWGHMIAGSYARQEKQSYGQLVGGVVHGDIGEIKRGGVEIYNHPLQPVLDALAVASAGIGTAARVGAMTEAMSTVKAASTVSTVGTESIIGEGVGNPLRVVPGANNTFHVRDAAGESVAGRFFSRDEAIAHARSLRVGGVDPDVLNEEIRKIEVPARGARGQAKILGEGLGLQPEFHEGGITPAEHANIVNEIQDWPSSINRPDRTREPGPYDYEDSIVGPRAMAHQALYLASHGLGFETAGRAENLITLRNADGSLGSVGSYALEDRPSNYLQSLGMPASPMIEVSFLGAKTPGAGIAAIAHLAKKYPGRGFDFVAANDEVASYYKSMGATQISSSEFVIPVDRAAAIARGEPLVGTTTKEVAGVTSTAKPTSPLRAGLRAAIQPGPQGSLIDAWQRARDITPIKENASIMAEILDTATDPNAPEVLPSRRERTRQTFADIHSNLKKTREMDAAALERLAENQPGYFSTPLSGVPAKAVSVALREAIDFVRAGAIFLRSAYLPNNWAGNALLTMMDRGPLALMDLARSMTIHKTLTLTEQRMLSRATGFNSMSSFIGARGGGYVNSVTDPIAHFMGRVGDQPFRDAQTLGELARKGYRTNGSVKKLFARINEGDEKALYDLADAGRKAQEAVIKFGDLNDIEKILARNVVFVYSWMRGAGRYFGRFPFQHPIQAAVYAHLGDIGQDYLDKNLGGVPTFLIGAIPVGRTKDGNPILINPFSVNPLGTGVQLMEAAAGTVQAAKGGKSFNKFAQQDVLSLTNPLIRSYTEAREGGRSVKESVTGSIAAARLIQDLQHPGRGGVYPTSREEAVGQYVVGSLFPREASQQAITKSLERENANNPVARLPEEVKQYQKDTGRKVPKDFVTALTADVQAMQQEKDFKTKYAQDHGRQGFSNMPARNQAEAALEYLRSHRLIAPTELQAFEDALKSLNNEPALKAYANRLWNITGTGRFKNAWDRMKQSAERTQAPERKIP